MNGKGKKSKSGRKHRVRLAVCEQCQGKWSRINETGKKKMKRKNKDKNKDKTEDHRYISHSGLMDTDGWPQKNLHTDDDNNKKTCCCLSKLPE